MDLTLAFQIAMAIVAALGGWLIRTLFDRLRSLEQADQRIAEQVAALRVDLPTHYVSKGDFQQLGDNLFAALRRIEDRLDRMVEKA